MAKMWAGVTAGLTDELADELNSSISFDKRLFEQDIKGSMAHAAMLSAKGIRMNAPTPMTKPTQTAVLRCERRSSSPLLFL